MPVNIDALASQAATQGQNQLNNYNNQASEYKGQYNNFSNQATAANKAVSDYTDYMKGAGSASNQYDAALGQQKTDLGYNQNEMTNARANLNQAQGAMSAYSDFANTAASKWGMNAGGFAAANAGALGSINNNIASNQNVVTGLGDLYKTAQAGANQKTGLVIQGQHETLGGFQSTYNNSANQRDSAASMMNFYDDLAQKQGGMNAQQQQLYGQAKQAYAAASQAMAQSALLLSQTHGQDLQNQMTTNGMNSQQYKDYLAGRVDANGKPIVHAGAAPAASGGMSWNPFSAGGGQIGHFMANRAFGADASQAAHGVGNYAKGLFTGASW